MSFIQRLAKSLRSARTVELPEDDVAAYHMLMPMVIGNQHKSVSELLSTSNFDVNYQFGQAHRTLLHISANCGSYECLCLFIKKGADVNAQEISGCTPLHLAARNGQKRCLIKLLENKANVNIKNNEGLTMIHWLAANGRADLLSDLFQYIQNVDINDAQGQTALHVASQNGHKSTVLCLLKHGADVNRQTINGWTPLHFACSHGQHDTAECLISRGAEHIVKTAVKTPLEISVEGGYSRACEILLSSWPHLYQKLVEFTVNGTVNPDTLWNVLKCLYVSSPHGNPVKYLKGLATEASQIGHIVLSTSAIPEEQISKLLRCSKVLPKLYKKFMKHHSDQVELNTQEMVTVFEPLESLWQLLTEWLIIVKAEVEHSNNTKIKTVSERTCNTMSASPNLFSLGNFEANSEHEKNLKPDNTCTEENVMAELRHKSSPSPCTVRRSIKQFSDESCDGNILEVIVPRMSAVIHAFYLVSSHTCVAKNDVSKRFLQFVSDNQSVLKWFVNRNPTVIFDHFYFLFDIPQLMSHFIHIVRSQPFEMRREWFYDNLAQQASKVEMTPEEQEMLVVDRGKLFQSSCSQLLSKLPRKLKKNLNMRFEGEEGMGQGVVREWFVVLSKEILNPDYGLFTQSADGCTFQPNCNSAVNPDHLNYFQFAGQCLGLALYHKYIINASFTRSFYKHILGIPVDYKDVASIDPDYAKNLQWILDHDISALGLDLTFSVETDVFGFNEEVELKPGGKRILVTEKNKAEYVQLVTELRMTRAIQPQIHSFLLGFNSYIPSKLIQMFDEYELELLLSGIPEIDLQDWRTNTTYLDCSPESNAIKWFWMMMEDFTAEDKVMMLQFVTGSSRLPYGGFSKLAVGGGPQKFTISLVPYVPGLLPSASTCINFLRLPDYPSVEIMTERVSVALRCGSQGYAMA